jgi:hypothetical protein
MKTIAVLVILSALTIASAKDKHFNPADYADGVLRAARSVENGMSCSSSGNATDDGSGGKDINTNGSCSSTTIWHYKVEAGGQAYVLAPALARPKTAMFTLGWSAAFQKHSVLYLQPIGTHVLLRVDPKREQVLIRIGDRESVYNVVALESGTN